jgi:hypothetical protein
MKTTTQMTVALDELKALKLPPTETACVQMVLIVQDFIKRDWQGMSIKPFEEWTVVDVCNALKIKVAA